MSSATEKLQRELQAAKSALAEALAHCERNGTEHLATIKQLDDNRKALLFMLEDLEAGRRKVELAHHEWIAALDVVNDPIFLHDKNFRIIRCNKAYQQCAGILFKEIIGQPYYKIFPKTDGPLPCCTNTMETEEEKEEEVMVGEAVYRSRTFAIHNERGVYLHSVHILENITERKVAETSLQHANRALATLSEVNRTLVRTTDESELLQAICDAIVGQRGYRMAWVGYVQQDAEKSVKIMARTGDDEGFPATERLTWAEAERGMGPGGRAIRSGATQLCQDIASDPLYLPWREEALKRGYASSIALPLLGADNAVFGILIVYAGEASAFSANEIALLEEMAGDMAFGVHTLNTRRERDLAMEQSQRHFAQLHKNLEDTVQVIATMVEMRDPYTAGHQTRVADLAAAIARQIGLLAEQVHGIHLAGVVHDLGKIKVPAEILSKPGKISGIEYELIKIHPQAGFDILKDIEFPWPIAQMVLQHHERLNGSGYPQGLKGDQIILGARILSVADVVEAISSHRPYRPGLGVDAALEEITLKRGAHYDPQVVDACVSLFRERGYALPQ